MTERKESGFILLRVVLSLVFLYFGFQQVLHPGDWTGFVPGFLSFQNITPNNIVMINGIVELSLGVFLLVGLYTKFSAIILSLHLFGIVFSMGLSPLSVRDLGLAVATLVVFLNGADRYCVDYKFVKNAEKPTK